MLYFATGITAAIAHVLSGPDHLAAVTPLAIESKNRSWGIGLAWGIGHTLGILLIGLLLVLFKGLIPVEAISEYSEQLVGIMLIMIGVWAIFKVRFKSLSKKHVHPHFHKNEEGDFVHVHGHDHASGHLHSNVAAHKHKHAKRYRQNVTTALGVGIFHGLAGVSHLLAILPTLALPGKFDAVMYLSGFGLGTITAMVLFSLFLGMIAVKTSTAGSERAFSMLRFAGGSIAILVGVWWIFLSF